MKYRSDFVTNSSSSSFILNFKNEDEAYATICKTFLKECEQDSDCRIIDSVVSRVNENKKTKEEALEYYLNQMRYYVEYKIEQKFRDDEEKYPREDWKDFRTKHSEAIKAATEKEMIKIKRKIEKQFKDKEFFSIVEFEDHYPEVYASELCESLPDVLIIDNH